MISLIVAKSSNGVIGKNNAMPWHIPAELKYFKEVTSNHTVIMGKNTLLSIGKALPNRRNIVLTTNPNFVYDNVEVVHSIHEAIALIDKDEEVFVIGGKMIYEQFLPFASKLYITEIEQEFDGDTFFPLINWDDYKLISKRKGLKDEKNNYNYYFNVYEKNKK